MKIQTRTLKKILALLGVFVMLTACNILPFRIVPNDMGDSPPREEEPFEAPPEEEPFHEGEPEDEPYEEGEPRGETWIEFNADRTQIAPGECTMIWWNAEGVEEVFLNGNPVEPTGEQEVCTDHTEHFSLEAGGERRELEIIVEDNPGGEHAPEEPPPPPSNPTSPPPPPNPTPGSAPAFSADFAITDLYITKNVNGEVVARVTNNGPGNAANVNFELECSATETAYKTGAMTIFVVPWTVPINGASLSPGQTKEYKINYQVNTTAQKYTVDCSVNVSWNDGNPGNNSYGEPFPPAP